MKRSLQKAFTLIELMIVVAVIAILGAVALPVYQDFIVRTKVAEAISAAGSCRTGITETIQNSAAATLPAANEWGCESNTTGASGGGPTKYVLSIVTSDAGKITVKTGDVADLKNAALKTIALVPYKKTGTETVPLTNADVRVQIYKWECGPGDGEDAMPPKYLPGSCRTPPPVP